MSYCFENCTEPKCIQSECVSGIKDAVDPQRTFTLSSNGHNSPDQYEGFLCDKGALYAPKATRDGIVIEPNLGTATTDKTIAILVRHEVGGSQGPVELDNQPDRGSYYSNVIFENEAFKLYR